MLLLKSNLRKLLIYLSSTVTLNISWISSKYPTILWISQRKEGRLVHDLSQMEQMQQREGYKLSQLGHSAARSRVHSIEGNDLSYHLLCVTHMLDTLLSVPPLFHFYCGRIYIKSTIFKSTVWCHEHETPCSLTNNFPTSPNQPLATAL